MSLIKPFGRIKRKSRKSSPDSPGQPRKYAPPILIFTLPMSRIESVNGLLGKALQRPLGQILNDKSGIDEALLDNLFADEGMFAGSLPFTADNLNVVLAKFTERKMPARIMVHTRDPRAVLYSRTNVIDALIFKKRRGGSVARLPEGYARLNENQKINYQIETHLESLCRWFECWKVQAEITKSMSILFTRHEELINDPDNFLSRVAAFYDGTGEAATAPDPNLIAKLREKVGDDLEWRDKFSRSNLEMCEKVMGRFHAVSAEYLGQDELSSAKEPPVETSSPILILRQPRARVEPIRGLVSRALSRPDVDVADPGNSTILEPALLERMAPIAGIGSSCAHANAENLGAIDKTFAGSPGRPKIVVHYRDPRQITLAWVRLVDQMIADGSSARSMQSLPNDYREWDRERKIAYQIDENLGNVCRWIERWRIQGEGAGSLDILFSNQGELTEDPRAWFKRLLDFYGIPASQADVPEQAFTDELQRDLGKENEWNDEFSHRNIEASNRIMSRFPAIAREFLEGGSRDAGARTSSGAYRRPPIIMFTLMKSGTAFIRKSLCRSLCRPVTRVCFDRNERVLVPEMMDTAFRLRGIVGDHVPASDVNIVEIKAAFARNGLNAKIMVNYRDPRQALLSWTYFTDKAISENKEANSLNKLPNDYEGLDFCAKVDYQIENNLSRYCHWIECWKNKTEQGIDILFCKQEELAQDQDRFFARILEFFEVPANHFSPPEKPKVGQVHFRSGGTNEWKDEWSGKQQEKSAEIMSAYPHVAAEFLT